MSTIERQRAFFQQGLTRSTDFRRKQLRRFKEALHRYESMLIDALREDLQKAPTESYLTEISMVYQEIDEMIRHLPRWSKPRRVPTSLAHFYSRSRIYPEPYGVVLVIAPWNYPVQLSLVPLIGAIAAGNCVILKPSELAPSVARCLVSLIQDTFDEAYVAALEGDGMRSQALLREGVDYCFFTGSPAVGRAIMEGASRHLTPVTLELGGKSPVLVTRDAKLEQAAQRIVWGKFTNAGQTCIAPDYILVDETLFEPFVEELVHAIRTLYGEAPLHNADYSGIIHERHYRRLLSLLDGQKIAFGGQRSDERLRLAPTIVLQPSPQDPIMQEEIFGPLLPVLPYSSLSEAIEFINARPKPLACYLFTGDRATKRRVIKAIPAGGMAVNDTLIHFSNAHLPFGGVGESGMGQYHGYESFRTFSHEKGVLEKTRCFDLPLRYPPYTERKMNLLRRFF